MSSIKKKTIVGWNLDLLNMEYRVRSDAAGVYIEANDATEGWKAPVDFDVPDCFDVLKAVAQNVCPTVVSMVFDVQEQTVYWCEKQEWDRIEKVTLL